MPQYDYDIDGEFWLDSDYRPSLKVQEARWSQLLGDIKVRAVIGLPLLTSDVGSFDSPLIVRLFEDTEFVSNFLADEPDFISLAVPTRNPLTSVSTPDLIKSGLERTRNPGWTSSLLPDSAPLQQMCAEIVQMDRLGSGDPGSGVAPAPPIERILKSVAPDIRRLLLGSLRSTWWFLNDHRAKVTAVPSNGANFFNVLEDNATLSPTIAQALSAVKARFPQEDDVNRTRRSSIRPHLLNAGAATSPINHQIWYQIVDAWNVAVSGQLLASGSQSTLVDDVTPIARTRQLPVGYQFHLQLASQAPTIPKGDWIARKLGIDIRMLRWSDIKTLVTRTDPTRRLLRSCYEERAYRTDDMFVAALQGHLDAVEKAAVDLRLPQPPRPLVLTQLVFPIATGALVLLMGGAGAVPLAAAMAASSELLVRLNANVVVRSARNDARSYVRGLLSSTAVRMFTTRSAGEAQSSVTQL